MQAVSESKLWKKKLGDWVINPYVGCEHGCVFCYCPSMPGVKFFNEGRAADEWGKYVLPKEGIVEALRAQLRTFTPEKAVKRGTAWGRGYVLMSFLTDCYQPLEAKLKLTRQCLQLLLEAGHRVRLQTRSALVERDFDILKAHRDQVLLGTSLPSTDEKLTRVLEPRASGLERRIRMLGKAADAGIPLYVAIAPVMPWVSKLDLRELIETAVDYDAKEIFCEVLNPKGSNLAKMVEVLRASGRTEHATLIERYAGAAWARDTHDVLRRGWGMAQQFVPWPDTGRAWAKHLSVDDATWLDQFLPPAGHADEETDPQTPPPSATESRSSSRAQRDIGHESHEGGAL